jgi:hypothetical protein
MKSKAQAKFQLTTQSLQLSYISKLNFPHSAQEILTYKSLPRVDAKGRRLSWILCAAGLADLGFVSVAMACIG